MEAEVRVIVLNTTREEVLTALESQGLKAKGKEYTLKLVQDTSLNPYTDWDFQMPLIYKSGRSSEQGYPTSEVKDFIEEKLNDLVINPSNLKALGFSDLVKLLSEMGFEGNITNLEELSEEESSKIDDFFWGAFRMDSTQFDNLKDVVVEILLTESFTDRFENLVTLCKVLELDFSFEKSVGNSQGDYAEVLFVVTDRWLDETGMERADLVEEYFKEELHTFECWMWGDIYSYSIEDEFGNFEESCGGFLGKPYEDSLAVEIIGDIDFERYGWTLEEALEKVKNAEIEY